MAPEPEKRTGVGVSPRQLKSVTTGLLKANTERRRRIQKRGQDIQSVLTDAMYGKGRRS